MKPICVGLIGFAVTLVSLVILRAFAVKYEFTDKPGGRKNHKQPTPVVGGLAMGIGLVVSAFFLPISFLNYEGLIFGGVLLLCVGVIDDILEVPARIRLLTQILAALAVMFYGKNYIFNLGAIFGDYPLHFIYPVAFILTLFAIVGYINAINMLDGVDGLAGSVVTLQAVFMLCLTINAHIQIDIYFLSLLLCCLLAFLIFNFPFIGRKQALVFMGDAGSMLLGFVMVWFSIKSSQTAPMVAKPVVFLWIAALPIFEIGYAILRRLATGVSPFKPDRKHLHHLLHDRGWGCFRTVLTVLLISIVTGLVGIIGEFIDLSDMLLFWGFVVCFIVYAIAMTILTHKMELKSKEHATL